MSGEDDSFGGMEKAFSTKTMMRHLKYFRFLEEGRRLADSEDSWKEPTPTTNKDKKRKKSSWGSNSPCGLWASLESDLLHSIMMKLNIVDYFAVGAVCSSWRSVATSMRDVYMKQQKPLVIVKSKWAKRTCFLYDIFDGEEYKTLLPGDMQNKRILGLSCGYLITLRTDKYDFWLINLMTRHELRYPALPIYKIDFSCTNFRPVLFNSTRHSKVFMIVFFKGLDRLFVSQNGAERWRVYTVPNATGGIAGVKVFKKKIYVVTADAHICVLDFSASPVMKLYNGNISMERQCTGTHLVIMDNQLCIRSTLDIVYELDDKNMVWVEKKEMGNYSLFVDSMNATMVDTSNWVAGNYICSLTKDDTGLWSVDRLNHVKRPNYALAVNHVKRPNCAPVVWHSDNKLVPWFWVWYWSVVWYVVSRSSESS